MVSPASGVPRATWSRSMAVGMRARCDQPVPARRSRSAGDSGGTAGSGRSTTATRGGEGGAREMEAGAPPVMEAFDQDRRSVADTECREAADRVEEVVVARQHD